MTFYLKSHIDTSEILVKTVKRFERQASAARILFNSYLRRTRKFHTLNKIVVVLEEGNDNRKSLTVV